MGGESYVNGSVFTVEFHGVVLGFSRISGIGSTKEYETYAEGGGALHLLPKSHNSAGTIVLEKGVSLAEREIPMLFPAGSVVSDLVITLRKQNQPVERYLIESGVIAGWELSELDAISAGVAIKKFTIAHTGIRTL